MRACTFTRNWVDKQVSDVIYWVKKSKVRFYIMQHPFRFTAPSALHFTPWPWQTCSFRHELGFSGKHFSHAAITRKEYSLTFPPPSIATYPFIQVSELGHLGENENAQSLKSKKGIRTLSLSIPAFYRARQVSFKIFSYFWHSQFLTYGHFVEYMNMHAASGLCPHGASNVGGVTAGQPWHNSRNGGGVTAGRWDTTLVYTTKQ